MSHMVYTTNYSKLCFMVIAYDLRIVLTSQEIGPQSYSRHLGGECLDSISTCLAQNA